MPRSTSLSRRSTGNSTLGRELRAASRRELATLKRELKDKHRERMKRSRTKEASERRKKLVMAAVETGGAATAAGAARAFLGDRLDVGPVPLELPIAIAGHLVGGYFYPDDERGDHVHNLSNGMLAVAAFQGSMRMTTWARERMNRREGVIAGDYPPAYYPPPYPGDFAAHAGALPPPPSLALPPQVPSAADQAMAEAIRVMEEARRG